MCNRTPWIRNSHSPFFISMGFIAVSDLHQTFDRDALHSTIEISLSRIALVGFSDKNTLTRLITIVYDDHIIATSAYMTAPIRCDDVLSPSVTITSQASTCRCAVDTHPQYTSFLLCRASGVGLGLKSSEHGIFFWLEIWSFHVTNWLCCVRLILSLLLFQIYHPVFLLNNKKYCTTCTFLLYFTFCPRLQCQG